MKKVNPTVVILMATYNGDNFLEEQINSILKQSYTQWTLYIHDDNSSDKTVDIVKKYQNQDKRIIYLDDSISYRSAARNFSYLLDTVDGDYIMFCDQDDIWLPNKIKFTLEVMLKEESKQPNLPILIHTDLMVTDSELSIIDNSFYNYMSIDPFKDMLNRLLIRNVVTGCTMMINKLLRDLVIPMPETIIVHDWWIALVARLHGHIIYKDKPTIMYRQHENNSIGANSSTSFTANVDNILKYNLEELKNYVSQGKDLLNIHKKKISDEDLQTLTEFTNIFNLNFLQRKLIIINKKFYYQNIFQNIGMIIRL